MLDDENAAVRASYLCRVMTDELLKREEEEQEEKRQDTSGTIE